jgi:type III pantothenate kinase
VNKIEKATKNSDLVIDIGNTRIKLAMFVDDALVEVISFAYESIGEISNIIDKFGAKRAILSAVTQVDSELIRILSERTRLLELKHDTPVPIAIDYATPRTLGVDRIANAVAAAKFYPDTDVLVIDFGTCIKYDLIDSKSVFRGGAISPGVAMRFKCMHKMTGKLPDITSWDAEDAHWPGRSSESSMKAGVLLGVQGEMMQFIESAADEYDQLIIISTGGDFNLFEKAFKNIIFAHPYLTLEGLHEILKYNID